MRTIQRIGAVTLALLLGACSDAGDDAERPQPAPIEETAFGDMAGTLDEARAVEAAAQEHKQAIDRALEQSEAAQ